VDTRFFITDDPAVKIGELGLVLGDDHRLQPRRGHGVKRISDQGAPGKLEPRLGNAHPRAAATGQNGPHGSASINAG
jgi:hypothetical protein